MIGEQDDPTLLHATTILYQAHEGPTMNFICFVKDFHKIQRVIADLESNFHRSETFSHLLHTLLCCMHIKQSESTT